MRSITSGVGDAGHIACGCGAEAADISQATAKEWVGLLQGVGIIYLLQPFVNK